MQSKPCLNRSHFSAMWSITPMALTGYVQDGLPRNGVLLTANPWRALGSSPLLMRQRKQPRAIKRRKAKHEQASPRPRRQARQMARTNQLPRAQPLSWVLLYGSHDDHQRQHGRPARRPSLPTPPLQLPLLHICRGNAWKAAAMPGGAKALGCLQPSCPAATQHPQAAPITTPLNKKPRTSGLNF